AQWQAAFDDAMKDNSPLFNYCLNGDTTNANAALRFQGLLAMANGDQKRARLIWAKIRQRQEFPMNFVEATSPIQDTPANGLRFIYLPPKQTYVQYLSAASGGHHTWAACLYMALRQVRGGRDPHLDESLTTTELADRTGDGVPE